MTQPKRRLDRATRERRILDTAAELFYARGVHAVGMDELVRVSGLGKATVYRLFPTKDHLVGAYLERLATEILGLIDRDVAAAAGPAAGLRSTLAAIEADLAREGFRGCAFNNAAMEYDDPGHPARVAARDYRRGLHQRLTALATALAGPVRGPRLGARLAVLVDGAYTSAAHLGPAGPAADGLALARELVAEESRRAGTPADGPTLG